MKGNKIKLLSFAVIASCSVSFANAGNIQSVDFGQKSNGKFEIQIKGDGLSNISSFSLSNPARLVLDIPNGKVSLSKRNIKINNGVVKTISFIEGDERTRATIGLTKMASYNVVDSANNISVVINGSTSTPKVLSKSKSASPSVGNVDFTKGSEGQGIVSISIGGDSSVDVSPEGRNLVAKVRGGKIPKRLRKRLKVSDFGTPVGTIDILSDRIVVKTTTDNFEFVSYQTDGMFNLEVSKPVPKKNEALADLALGADKVYEGKPLSLNFQDIEVRSVIQLIADFTETNIVISDSVAGNITLRLNDVPWDQALDVIMRTKGLSKRESGDVIYISTTEDLAKGEGAVRTEAKKRIEDAPLQTQLIEVQYARADMLEELLDNRGNTSKDNDYNNGFLSRRGSISVDARTNTILIQDVPSRIAEIRRLIDKLDKPVKQVLVDARLVTATDSFSQDLGVRFGGAFTGSAGSTKFGGAGTITGADTAAGGGVPSLDNRLGVNLPAAGSSMGLAILGSDFLLDMELSALEQEGRGEVISSPRVIAQDGSEAYISQGQEVPFASVSQEGTETEFKEIELKLTVTPKIAPNDMVDMLLKVTKDALAGTATISGEPIINTSEVQTQVLVENGQTVVLGGVYEQTKIQNESKVPLLGDIPGVGRLFRKDITSFSKNELLIFVTPKIINKRFIQNDKFSELRNN